MSLVELGESRSQETISSTAEDVADEHSDGCSLSPNERRTLSIVDKLGLPVCERALYKLSRPSPDSAATAVIPFDLATSPRVAEINCGDPDSKASSK